MQKEIKLSVVICAYNPKPKILSQVIDSLKSQTFPKEFWELIIIDNNSDEEISSWLNLDWQPNSKFFIEKVPGLIFSRISGNRLSKSNLVITVDDDTPLDQNYLEAAFSFFQNNLDIHLIGGKCSPIYEDSMLPSWIDLLPSSISGRDFGDEIIIEQLGLGEKLYYPKYGPILIAYRKSIFDKYTEVFNAHKNGALGRKGDNLSSGEDNDIVLYFFKNNFKIAYHPKLAFSHIIPRERLTFAYAKKLLYESNRSWVHVLFLHDILTWRPIKKNTLIFRKIKSYVFMKAWKSKTNYLKWLISCGIYKGLSEIRK